MPQLSMPYRGSLAQTRTADAVAFPHRPPAQFEPIACTYTSQVSNRDYGALDMQTHSAALGANVWSQAQQSSSGVYKSKYAGAGRSMDFISCRPGADACPYKSRHPPMNLQADRMLECCYQAPTRRGGMLIGESARNHGSEMLKPSPPRGGHRQKALSLHLMHPGAAHLKGSSTARNRRDEAISLIKHNKCRSPPPGPGSVTHRRFRRPQHSSEDDILLEPRIAGPFGQEPAQCLRRAVRESGEKIRETAKAYMLVLREAQGGGRIGLELPNSISGARQPVKWKPGPNSPQNAPVMPPDYQDIGFNLAPLELQPQEQRRVGARRASKWKPNPCQPSHEALDFQDVGFYPAPVELQPKQQQSMFHNCFRKKSIALTMKAAVRHGSEKSRIKSNILNQPNRVTNVCLTERQNAIDSNRCHNSAGHLDVGVRRRHRWKDRAINPSQAVSAPQAGIEQWIQRRSYHTTLAPHHKQYDRIPSSGDYS